MKIIKSIKKIRDFIKQQKKLNKTIGFVPTMGYLHQGHLSLVKQAKKDNDLVIMSIFVNPTQFGPKEDFKKYPRNLKRDIVLAKKAGVDIIFYPSTKEIYPNNYLTFVEAEKLSSCLCDKSRPGHFKGVTTIVAKLFNIIQPDIAYFGQKDAQQAIIIKKMVKDLNMPVEIKVMPIVRDKDGLALSSRNVYLNQKQRKEAPVLYQSLLKAKSLIKIGQKNAQKIILVIRKTITKNSTGKIDYISIVDLENLRQVKIINPDFAIAKSARRADRLNPNGFNLARRGNPKQISNAKFGIKKKILIALAVWFGKTRLIDNIII